jgi:hypothetical protein
LIDERAEVGWGQWFFSIHLIHPVEDFKKIFGNRFFQAEKVLRGLKGSEIFLNILFEVLDEDNRFPFKQEIESFLSPVDFQKAVDDQNDENDSGENRKVDGGEASTDFLTITISKQSVSLPILPGARLSWGSWAPWGCDRASFAEKDETPAQGTRI